MRDWLNVAWYFTRRTAKDLVVALVIIGFVLFFAFSVALVINLGRL